jgi:hypothetical protein
LLAGAAGAGLVTALAAFAGTVDRVQVGVGGRNATEGLSPALYVDVPVVAGYVQSKFDGEQGDWQGPTYTASQSTTTGRTDLFFRADFENHVGSLDGSAQHALVHKDWTLDRKSPVKVPRLLAGRVVGAVGGELAVYAEPITGAARWETVLAIPLCRGVFGAVDFYADAPPQDTSGTAGQYLVGTTPAKQWNHDHAVAAARGVKLDGPLPGTRVAAHAVGRRVTGKVSDCGGGLEHLPVMLQGQAGSGWSTASRGLTGPGGAFRLVAPGGGSFRVSVTFGPLKAATATVRVR